MMLIDFLKHMHIDKSKVINIAYSELDDCIAFSATIKKQDKQLDVPDFMKKSGHYKELA